MNSLTKFTYSSFLVSVLFLNAACSALDEESTGAGLTNTTNTDLDISSLATATITDTNKENLATAATESLKQAVQNKDSSGFLGAKVASENPVQLVTVAAAQQIALDPSQAIIPGEGDDPSICDNDGTIDLNINDKVLTIVNCTIDGFTLNGTATITTSESGDIITSTYSFIDFTVTDGLETETLNLIAVCENNKTTATLSCSYKSESDGIDGRGYISLTSSISGDATGYFVTATVNDPDHGNVTVTTETGVTFNCPAPSNQPDSGSITVSDGSNSMNVTFNDCNSYTVDFNGTTVTFNWPAII